RGADLSGADLRGADLRGADLSGADLRGADLGCATGNLKQVKSIHTERWIVTYTDDTMFIGCQTHPLTDWWGFDDRTINAMDVGALKWWRKWKPILQAIIEAPPAEPTKTKTEATT
ncbi:pentapeptide repeat-containing protein, partial [Ensifer adhaerens]|uniref:pentapeptide repeat-containing protein n=1 Tax=Ensifer adhaerens TaxID=106592 RepID=UPI0018F7FDA3